MTSFGGIQMEPINPSPLLNGETDPEQGHAPTHDAGQNPAPQRLQAGRRTVRGSVLAIGNRGIQALTQLRNAGKEMNRDGALVRYMVADSQKVRKPTPGPEAHAHEEASSEESDSDGWEDSDSDVSDEAPEPNDEDPDIGGSRPPAICAHSIYAKIEPDPTAHCMACSNVATWACVDPERPLGDTGPCPYRVCNVHMSWTDLPGRPKYYCGRTADAAERGAEFSGVSSSASPAWKCFPRGLNCKQCRACTNYEAGIPLQYDEKQLTDIVAGWESSYMTARNMAIPEPSLHEVSWATLTRELKASVAGLVYFFLFANFIIIKVSALAPVFFYVAMPLIPVLFVPFMILSVTLLEWLPAQHKMKYVYLGVSMVAAWFSVPHDMLGYIELPILFVLYLVLCLVVFKFVPSLLTVPYHVCVHACNDRGTMFERMWKGWDDAFHDIIREVPILAAVKGRRFLHLHDVTELYLLVKSLVRKKKPNEQAPDQFLVDSLQIDGESYNLEIDGFEVEPKTYVAAKVRFGAGEKSSIHRYDHDWSSLELPDEDKAKLVPEETKKPPGKDKDNERGLAIATWFNKKPDPLPRSGFYPVLSGKWHEHAKVDLILNEVSTFSLEFFSSLFWGHWAIRVLTSVLLVIIVNAPSGSILITAYLTYLEQCPGYIPTEITFDSITICMANATGYQDCQHTCKSILTFLQGCHDRVHLSYAEIGLPLVLSAALVYCFAMEAANEEHHKLLKKFIQGMSVSESEKKQVEDVDKAMSGVGSFRRTAAQWKEYFWYGKMNKYKVCNLSWDDVPFDQKAKKTNKALTKVTDKQLSSMGDRFWNWEEVRTKSQLVAQQLDNNEKPNPQGIEEDWAAWTHINVTRKQWAVLAKEIRKKLSKPPVDRISPGRTRPDDVVEFSGNLNLSGKKSDDLDLASRLLRKATLLEVEGKYGSVTFPQRKDASHHELVALEDRTDDIAEFRMEATYGMDWWDAFEYNGIQLCFCEKDWKQVKGDKYEEPPLMLVWWCGEGVDTAFSKFKSKEDETSEPKEGETKLKVPTGALVFCYNQDDPATGQMDKWMEVVKIEILGQARKDWQQVLPETKDKSDQELEKIGLDGGIFLHSKINVGLKLVASIRTNEEKDWKAPFTDLSKVTVAKLKEFSHPDKKDKLLAALQMLSVKEVTALLDDEEIDDEDFPGFRLVPLILSGGAAGGSDEEERPEEEHTSDGDGSGGDAEERFYDYANTFLRDCWEEDEEENWWDADPDDEEEEDEEEEDDFGGLDLKENYVLLLKLRSAPTTRDHMLKATECEDWGSENFPNWFIVAQMEAATKRREKRQQLNEMMLGWMSIPFLSLIFALVAPITRLIQDGSPMFPAPFTYQIFFVCVFLFLMMNIFLLIYHRVTLRMTVMAGFLDDFRQLTIDPSGTQKVAGLLGSMIAKEASKEASKVVKEVKEIEGRFKKKVKTDAQAVESGVHKAAGLLDEDGREMLQSAEDFLHKAAGAVEEKLEGGKSAATGPEQKPDEQQGAAQGPQGTDKPDDSTENPFDLYVPETKAPYMPWLQDWRKAWAAKKYNLDKWQNCQTYLRVYLSQSRLVAQAMLVAAAIVLGFLFAISLLQAGVDPRAAAAATASAAGSLPNGTSALQLEMLRAAEETSLQISEVARRAAFDLSPQLMSRLAEAEQALVQVSLGASTVEAPLDISVALASLQSSLRPHYQLLEEPLLQQVEVLSQPARRLAYSDPTEFLSFQLPQNLPSLKDLARVTITQYVTVVTAFILLIYTLPLIYHIALINSNFDEHVALLTTVKSTHTDLQAKRDASSIPLPDVDAAPGSSTAAAAPAGAAGSAAPAVVSSGPPAPGGKEKASSPPLDVTDPEVLKFGRVVADPPVDGKVSRRFVVNSGADEGLQTYVRSLDSAIESCRVKSFPLVLFGFAISFTLLGTWCGLAASPILSQAKQIAPKLVVQGCLYVENTHFFQRLGPQGQKLFQDVVCEPIEDSLFPPDDNSSNSSNSTNSSEYYFSEHAAMVIKANQHLNAVSKTTGKLTLRGLRQLPTEPLSETLRSWWSSLQGRDKDKLAIARLALAQYQREAMKRLVLVPNIITEVVHKSGWELALELALVYLNEDPVQIF